MDMRMPLWPIIALKQRLKAHFTILAALVEGVAPCIIKPSRWWKGVEGAWGLGMGEVGLGENGRYSIPNWRV